jgi:DNA polymerase-1
MPDDLRASLGYIRRIVEGFHDPVVELDGYEADDVIGTLAVQARAAGLDAVIVSGDKDFYQLVGPGIHLMNPGRGGSTGVAAEWVTEENAAEKFGIPPSQVADYLALVGDSSDNVPGARGVGPKTAVQLLQQHAGVEELIAHAAELSPSRAAKSLEENAAEVRMSKRLVTIMTDLDIELDLEALAVREPDHEALRDIFVELEFRKLAEDFAAIAQARGAPALLDEAVARGSAARVASEYRVIDSLEGVAEVVEAVRAAGRVALAAVASTDDPLRGDLVALALSVEEGSAWSLPFGHQQAFELTFEGDDQGEVRSSRSKRSSTRSTASRVSPYGRSRSGPCRRPTCPASGPHRRSRSRRSRRRTTAKASRSTTSSTSRRSCAPRLWKA